MRIYNELMSRHTTFKIGGPVQVMEIPESEQELMGVISGCIRTNIKYYIFGGGSNILVRDQGLKGVAIKTTKACLGINQAEDNRIEVGASVRLQDFIDYCLCHDLESFEYLYSVPGTIGGAIYMNAGRGKSYNLQISNRLESVKCFDGSNVVYLRKEQCNFGYRTSVFQKNKKMVILSAIFSFQTQPKTIGEEKVRKRMTYVMKYQDRAYPSAGSVFRSCSPHILNMLKGLRFGGAQFSKKTSNWINNAINAKASDVLVLIAIAKVLNRVVLKNAELEIEIW